MFDELKDRIKDQSLNLAAQIKESSAFNSVKEKFETLPLSQQKIIIFGLTGLITLMIIMVPFGYFSSSWNNEESFTENRDQIKELLRASTIKTSQSSSIGFNANASISRLRAKLKLDIQEDQIESVEPFTLSKNPRFVPSQIETSAIRIVLKQLNLNQVVRLGHSIQSFSDNSQLLNMAMKADSENDHYYNVTFELVGFDLKTPKESEASSDKKNSKASRKRSRSGR